MTTISMTKTEIYEKLRNAGIPKDINGDYHIVKILEVLGLIHVKPETETLYEKHFPDTYGTITIVKRERHLELWVGGKWQCEFNLDDV